jgi:hypothetical protein
MAACLWILWQGLAASPPIDVKDIHVGMMTWMTVLSFPSSLLVLFASDLIASLFGSYYFSLAWKYHPAFFASFGFLTLALDWCNGYSCFAGCEQEPDGAFNW